ncbi:hypothetical protein [Nocardia brasiliensis]|uniref:hypothetical protein n=1 Tax=Nocardia brasiliensis TaxID=37326 RepID=UPI00142D9821|nr:hypothetical protein [Nocardia brasiliensis]
MINPTAVHAAATVTVRRETRVREAILNYLNLCWAVVEVSTACYPSAADARIECRSVGARVPDCVQADRRYA